MKRLISILSIVALVGCAAPGHLNTPSGAPEITVHSNSQSVQKECIHWLLGHGFEVGNLPETPAQVVRISGHILADNGSTNTWLTFYYDPADSTTTTIYAKKLLWRRNVGDRPQTSQVDYEELQNDLQEIAAKLK